MSLTIEERLAQIGPLQEGAHPGHDAMCIMEAVAFVAGEPWSDAPECACPILCAFMQSWNDALPDAERDALLRPLIPRLIGTLATKEIEQCRATMAADWLIREHTPAWLRLAGLNKQADALASLPEITDFLQCPSLMPTLEAVRTDADAAWAAAWAAAGATARDAAMGAAGAAAWDAAWDAAMGAAGAAARAAAWDALWAAAWDAAWAAAGATARDAAMGAAMGAARDAAWDALNATRLELQQSALRLVGRMIDCGQ